MNHKDLDVWKVSLILCAEIYEKTKMLPVEERYALTAQIRRACISIVSNIAEGAARQSKKEFLQFLHCSLGSAAEVEAQLEIIRMLGFLKEVDLHPLFELQGRVSQMLCGLIRKMKS